MNDRANLFFRASVSFLVLSFVFCVVVKRDVSEDHSINRVLNPKQDVQSTLGSISVRHVSRLTDGYHTSPTHNVIERMENRLQRRERKTNKMAVLGESRQAMDQDGLSDSPRLPDNSEENQFTFTSPGSRGLVIQVKPFVQFRGFGRRRRRAVSYKVYVLEGDNIRHYNVQFPSGGLNRATFDEREIVANCVRRRYLRRCIDLPLRRKGFCTTRIVERCVPGFVVFEDASSATLGTPLSSPLASLGPILSPSPELDSADDDEN